MVASGVPDRIPDHADQIANMSFDLVHACMNFRISHMPAVPLLIRVGINSG